MKKNLISEDIAKSIGNNYLFEKLIEAHKGIISEEDIYNFNIDRLVFEITSYQKKLADANLTLGFYSEQDYKEIMEIIEDIKKNVKKDEKKK